MIERFNGIEKYYCNTCKKMVNVVYEFFCGFKIPKIECVECKRDVDCCITYTKEE